MTDKITVLYDTIRLEEKLLIKAAERHNIDIEMVDCKQLFVDLNKIKRLTIICLQNL